MWNGFNVIGKKQFLLEPILMIVEKTVHTILEDKGRGVCVCVCMFCFKSVHVSGRGQSTGAFKGV